MISGRCPVRTEGPGDPMFLVVSVELRWALSGPNLGEWASEKDPETQTFRKGEKRVSFRLRKEITCKITMVFEFT